MGYTMTFHGGFVLDRPLAAPQAAYLAQFAWTRRMRRIPALMADMPDPHRAAVGLPLGPEGGYFTGGLGEHGQDEDEADSSVLDYDAPPVTQPGLWCHWVPTADRRGIVWNGVEKFYCYDAWLHYLIGHFLEPWVYTLSGKITYQGEDQDDTGLLIVKDNRLIIYDLSQDAGGELAED